MQIFYDDRKTHVYFLNAQRLERFKIFFLILS